MSFQLSFLMLSGLALSVQLERISSSIPAQPVRDHRRPVRGLQPLRQLARVRRRARRRRADTAEKSPTFPAASDAAEKRGQLRRVHAAEKSVHSPAFVAAGSVTSSVLPGIYFPER